MMADSFWFVNEPSGWLSLKSHQGQSHEKENQGTVLALHCQPPPYKIKSLSQPLEALADAQIQIDKDNPH
jgi:hypothetical protein